MYYVYVLKSCVGKGYYIGSTNNLEDRLRRHNQGRVKATKYRGPWELVYFKEYRTRSEAVRNEQHIKKQKSNKYIESLVEKFQRARSSAGRASAF